MPRIQRIAEVHASRTEATPSSDRPGELFLRFDSADRNHIAFVYISRAVGVALREQLTDALVATEEGRLLLTEMIIAGLGGRSGT